MRKATAGMQEQEVPPAFMELGDILPALKWIDVKYGDRENAFKVGYDNTSLSEADLEHLTNIAKLDDRDAELSERVKIAREALFAMRLDWNLVVKGVKMGTDIESLRLHPASIIMASLGAILSDASPKDPTPTI